MGLVEQVAVATPLIQLQLEEVEAMEDPHVGLVEQAVVETRSIQQQQLLRQLIPHQRMLLVLVVARDVAGDAEEAVVGVPLERNSFECFPLD